MSQNGKGDRPRNVGPKFKENYDSINWSKKPTLYCSFCKTRLILSDGWIPTYNNPDNSNSAPIAEPFCPKCEAK